MADWTITPPENSEGWVPRGGQRGARLELPRNWQPATNVVGVGGAGDAITSLVKRLISRGGQAEERNLPRQAAAQVIDHDPAANIGGGWLPPEQPRALPAPQPMAQLPAPTGRPSFAAMTDDELMGWAKDKPTQPDPNAIPLPGRIHEDPTTPPFYSQLRQTAEQKLPNRFSADQMQGTMRGSVKPDEMKWTGVDDQLARNTGTPVEKSDLMNFLDDHGVQIKEVHKGDPGPQGKFFDSDGNDLPEATKYHSYTEPGGENYKELLLTVPSGVTKGQQFNSVHWDEPNIIAHIRFNERRTENGQRSLFLEEVQSDWHQKGRTEGYKKPDIDVVRLEMERDDLSKQLHHIIDNGDVAGGDNQQYKDLYKRIDEISQDLLDNKRRAPEGPFSKTWPELAFKRMLRYAAENDFDQISWTNGKQQAARYNQDTVDRTGGMSGFYDKILPEIANRLGKPFGAKSATQRIEFPQDHVAWDGPKVTTYDVEEKLEEVLDKLGTAQRGSSLQRPAESHATQTNLRAQRNTLQRILGDMKNHRISFEDSLQGWPDKLVDEMFGGTTRKVTHVNPQSVNVFNITPEMRQVLLHKGMPLFAAAATAGAASQGWTPPDQQQQVGSGQSVGWGASLSPEDVTKLLSDEEERKRRQQFGWDPGARLGQVGNDIRRNALPGLVEGAMLPLEAVSAGIRYGGGVIHGIEQGIGEHLAGRQLEGAGRVVEPGILETEPKVLPNINSVGDVFDPAQANQRYNAIMNPVTDFGAQLLTPLGAGGKLASAAGGLAAKAPGIRNIVGAAANFRKEAPLALPLGAGIAGEVGDVLRSKPVQRGLQIGVPAATGLAAASESEDDNGEELPLPSRLVAGGAAALGGVVLGQGLTLGLRALGTGLADTKRFYDFATPRGSDPAWLPITKQVREDITQGRLQQAGGAKDTNAIPTYPGGYLGKVFDLTRQEITDRTASIQTWQNSLEEIHLAATGARLPDSLRAGDMAQLLSRTKSGASYDLKKAAIVFKDAGVTAENADDWGALMYGVLARQRISKVGGRKATGAIQNVTDAKAFLQNQVDIIDDRYPVPSGQPLTSQKWVQAARDFTKNSLNPMLDEAEQVGLLAPGDAAKIKGSRDIFGRFIRLTRNAEDYGKQPTGQSLLPTDRDIDHWYGTKEATDLTLAGTLNHMATMRMQIEQNKVGQAMLEWTKMSPAFASNFRTEWDGKPWTSQTTVPPGWSHIPVWVDGKDTGFLVREDMRDMLMGLTVNQADMVTNTMAKLSQPFHAGVTALSIPFIFRNVPRDYQGAVQNRPGFMTFNRNYLGAWMDTLSGGLDEFVANNAGHPAVQALPGKIAKAFDWGARKLGSPNYLDEFRSAGNDSSTFINQLRTGEDVAGALNLPGGKRSIFDKPLPGTGVVGGISVKTPLDLISAASLATETAARLAVYQIERNAGNSVQGASLAQGKALVDFSKGGNAVRIASMWLPLLNARVQGTLTSYESMKNDPTGYAQRLAMSSAIPTIFTYAYNRLVWNDLYDQIPVDEKDRNHVIILGSYKNEREQEKPIYVRMAKNEMTAAFSSPLEHFLDTMFHVKSGQQVLEGDQRTERSEAQMWLSRLASFLPINANSGDLLSPGNLIVAGATMNPIIGTLGQMWANKDQFNNRPVVSDDLLRLPSQYQYDQNTPTYAKAISAFLHEAGIPGQANPSPARIAFMVRGFGGTAAETFAGSGDVLWNAIDAASKAAGQPGMPDFKPRTYADLGMPDGANQELWKDQLDKLEKLDTRPWYLRTPILKTLLGASGGAQTTLEKTVNSLSPDDREVWQQTIDFQDDYSKATRMIDEEQEKLYREAGKGLMTHAVILDRIDKLNQARNGAYQSLQIPHPKAILDYDARKQFVGRLPGVPNTAQFFGALTEIPPEIDIKTLADRLANYKSLPENAGVGPLALDQKRTLELQGIANQYKVPVSVLRDYVSAEVLGRTLPSLGMPDLAFENLVNQYRSPQDPENPDITRVQMSSDKVALLRQVLVHETATKWGVSDKDLVERVQSRFTDPIDQNPIAQSRERAFNLDSKLSQMPLFADKSGQPVGMPQEWPTWLAMMEKVKNNPRLERDPVYKDLITAKGLADRNKIVYEYQHPDYQDWARWFGPGRNMTLGQWDGYNSGQYLKYKDNPGIQESLRRDAMIRLYGALPDRAPERRAIGREVSKAERQLVPGWRAQMLLDDAAKKGLEYDDLYDRLEA